MKKLLLTLFAVFLVFGLLAACGPQRSAEEVNNAQKERSSSEGIEKPEKLVVWVNNNEDQKTALKEIFTKYTKKTGIQIEMIETDMLSQIEKLSLDGPAGKGPDLFFQPHDRLGDILLQGLAAPVQLGEEEKQYSETAVSAVTYEGQTYGLPMVVETYGLFYNKDKINEAPKTLDELQAIMKEHTNSEKKQYGFLMEAANLYFAFPFFSNNDSYIFKRSADGTYDINDIGLANEGAVQTGQMISEWFADKKMPTEITQDILNGVFEKGDAAVVLNGPWALPQYKAALGEKLGAAPLPDINGSPAASLVGVKSWMLSSYSKNSEWATDLMKFISNEENSLLYYEKAGEMPANRLALENEKITTDPLISAFAKQVENGEPMPNIPEIQQVWEPFNKALELLSKGEDTGVLEESVQEIKNNIEASGGGK
ncbi:MULTISPECIES: sugar ABC transporter substrate-binding protein [Bacillus]|uniref:Maltodextrin-binding protein n=2 Tax=Bacillus TaxID=1386 RepID=A0A0M4G6X0_9BACI|nr:MULTISPECIES: extracellular solute-binding protein [Bacillus]ALC80695.1 ABC transporter substrate-binding protein [Bacillus gobiensis]MBP1079587.1 arabinogalactan oligomer/maltooligosaccharide transport system substrate-binding protein [Bacillus capparidis]MED1094988.1 extracellular solute-binding protein [Bacillus capparidis]